MGLIHENRGQWIGSGDAKRWCKEGIVAERVQIDAWMQAYFDEKCEERKNFHHRRKQYNIPEENIRSYISNTCVRPPQEEGEEWRIHVTALHEFKAMSEDDRQAAEKKAVEEAEAQRLEAQRAEAERSAAEKVRAEKVRAERAQARKDADKQRRAEEKAEAQRVRVERRAEEKVRAEKARAERAQAAKDADKGRRAAEKAAMAKAEMKIKAAERKAAAEKIAAQKRAEIKMKAAETKAAAEKIAAQKRAEMKMKAAERKAAAESKEAQRIARAENREAERKAAAIKKEAQKAVSKLLRKVARRQDRRERLAEKRANGWVGYVYFLRKGGPSIQKQDAEKIFPRFVEALRREFVMNEGMTAEDAARKVEKEWVKFGTNNNGDIAWVVRFDKAPAFEEWYAEEKHWIAPTAKIRRQELGLRHSETGIANVISDIFDKEVSYLVMEGKEPQKARYEVEKNACRMGLNIRRQPTWQFHEKFAPVVSKRMEFVSPAMVVTAKLELECETKGEGTGQENPTRHRKHVDEKRQKLKQAVKDLGLFYWRPVIAGAIEKLHDEEIKKRCDEGMSLSRATRMVERDIAVFGANYTGHHTWQVNTDYLSCVRDIVVTAEKEAPFWHSATHSNLRERGVRYASKIVNLALAYLHKREISERVEGGMDPEKATLEVESGLVRLGLPRGSNVPAWQYHESMEPRLVDFLRQPRQWLHEAIQLERLAAQDALPTEARVPLYKAPRTVRKHWKEQIRNDEDGGRMAVSPTWVVRAGAFSMPLKRIKRGGDDGAAR